MEQRKAENDIMSFFFEETKHLAEHRHRSLELLYVLEGKLSVSVAGKEWQMEQNEFVLIGSNVPHSYRSTQELLVGCIHMNYQELLRYIDLNRYDFRCNSSIDKNQGYQKAEEVIRKIFRLYFEKDRQRIYLTSLYYELLQILVSHFTYQREEAAGKEKGGRVDEIVKYIHNNYQSAVSLNDLADYLHLSTAYLSKYIKQNLGINFFEYLNEVRLERAMKDIWRGEKTLTTISLDNGFANPNAFSISFKKKFGQTPSVWLREHQQEIEQRKRDRLRENEKKSEHIRAFLEKDGEPDREETESGNGMCVDVNRSAIYGKNWEQMINIGSVNTLQGSDMQAQIRTLHEELGFCYLRFWDVFSPEMLQRREEGAARGGNYARLDRIFDFVIRNGMHPFIELGFKPTVLLRNIGDSLEEREREILFSTHAEMAEALYRLLAHCVNRYGVEEVGRWRFELWADPRVTEGDDYGQYFEMFETLYPVLKSISSQIKVGGAGFGRLYTTLDFREILELWRKRMCYPDFISIYCYPYLARGTVNALNSDRIQDNEFVHNQVSMMRQVMESASFHEQELYVTEWSPSVSVRNALNDSASQGAFLLKTIVDNMEAAELLGYWRASDLVSEHFDTGVLLHGGNGLLSADGIRKPSFYAFKFARQLGRYLLGRDEHGAVTTDGAGSYTIVCHHYVAPNFSYYLKEENQIEPQKEFLLFDQTQPLPLSYQIRNIRNGTYLVKMQSVNQEWGSVQDEWGRMGYRENLNQEDVAYLKEICRPKMTMRECEVADQTLCVRMELAPHEIRLVQIIYQVAVEE